MTSFRKTLLTIPAKQAAEVLHVPLRTVYSWRTGEKVPSPLTQHGVVMILRTLRLSRK